MHFQFFVSMLKLLSQIVSVDYQFPINLTSTPLLQIGSSFEPVDLCGTLIPPVIIIYRRTCQSSWLLKNDETLVHDTIIVSFSLLYQFISALHD